MTLHVPSSMQEPFAKSLADSEQSNFAVFLSNTFGRQAARQALEKYGVGRSDAGEGKDTMFFRYDINKVLKSVSIQRFDRLTGKKTKNLYCSPIFPNCAECEPFTPFFGEHLIPESDSDLAIVEHERTAIVLAILLPQFTWMAASSCDWADDRLIETLHNHGIMFVPDFGISTVDPKQTCFQWWTKLAVAVERKLDRGIFVNDWMENNLPESERSKQIDFADVVLKSFLMKSLALQNNDPSLFDTNIDGLCKN